MSRVFLAFTFVEVLQGHKGNSRVQTTTVKTEALHGNDVFDLRLLFEVVLDLGNRFNRTVGCRTGRQLDVGNHVALIFLRQERGWHAHVQKAQNQHHDQVDEHHPTATTQGLANKAFVAVGGTRKDTVEPAKEATLGFVMALGDRFQQGRAQSRRKGQCQKAGEGNRYGHGHRELTVNHPHRTGHECQGQEHGRQHQRNTHNSATNLRHGFLGGFFRREPVFHHDTFDVLHHHDRIVHQNTNGQHHREHGQYVHGHAQHLHHREGPQNSHRHHQCRDQGVAHVLQEHVHHDEHQHHGFQQGVDHLSDGFVHVGRGVVRNVVADVFREELGQLLHFDFNRCGGIQRVRFRQQGDSKSRCRFAVQTSTKLVVVRPHFHTSDVFNTHGGTISLRAQNDVFKLFHGCQLTVHRNRSGHTLAVLIRWAAQNTGGHQHVLLTNRVGHICRAHLVADQLGRVQPHTHGATGCKQLEASHTRNTGNRVLDIAFNVVGQSCLIQAAVRGGQGHHLQKAGTGLLHVQALLHHRCRQGRGNVADPVLDVHLSHVRIGTRTESSSDFGRAVGVTDGLVVQQAFGTVQLIFDHTGYRTGDVFRRRTWVGRPDGDRRWCHIGILRYRHIGQGQ